MDTFILDVSDTPASEAGRRTRASCCPVISSYWTSGTVGIAGLAIAAVEARRQSREKHFGENPISFEIGKSCISANRRKHFGSENSLFLLTLCFLWFWAFQGNKQCTCSHDKQSASLYIRQDSIDMLHSLTQGHAHTQSAAIRSSCTQSLGVDFSPTTPREAFTHSARRVHARTVKRTRTRGGIQGGNMIISHMSIRNHITFEPI